LTDPTIDDWTAALLATYGDKRLKQAVIDRATAFGLNVTGCCPTGKPRELEVTFDMFHADGTPWTGVARAADALVDAA